MYVDAAPVSTVIDNADSPRHIDRNGTLCYNHLAIAGSPYTAHTTVEMAEDPTYNPGQTWWEKLWGTIGSWWRSIPKWQKVLVGAIFIAVSIGIAVATCGASVGPEAQLLGGAAAATALATAAKVALIEVSIGIGFAVAGWAINAADTGDWSINSLENSIADSIFFTGVFLFISTSVSAIKYSSRVNNTPITESNTLYSYELDPRSIERAKDGSQNWDAVRRRIWRAEAEFRPDYYKGQIARMKLGGAPKVNGKSLQLHHVVGKANDMYNVIKVTQVQHIAIHRAIGYHYNSMWTIENILHLL